MPVPTDDRLSHLKAAVAGLIHARRTFTMGGERYRYHAGAYNKAWSNERTVELPIVLRRLERARGRRVLEVGNVLCHYVPIGHEVVDKYESAPNVQNVDVLDFAPPHRYDLIMMISTLEHVGFDEDVREPDKPLQAIDHLAGLLAPGGELLVTIPLGYNPDLDEVLRGSDHHLDSVSFLRRVSRDNRWREATAAEVRESRYNDPYPAANGLAVGVRSAHD